MSCSPPSFFSPGFAGSAGAAVAALGDAALHLAVGGLPAPIYITPTGTSPVTFNIAKIVSNTGQALNSTQSQPFELPAWSSTTMSG